MKKKNSKVTNDNFYDLLHDSLSEGLEHATGKITLRTEKLEVPDEPPAFTKGEIKKIRSALGMSQAVLAKYIGCTVNAVQAWELGTNAPNGTARRILQILKENPEVFIRVVLKKIA